MKSRKGHGQEFAHKSITGLATPISKRERSHLPVSVDGEGGANGAGGAGSTTSTLI